MTPLTDAERKIVEDNLGLVGNYLTRRGIVGDERDDAFQDGVLGLMRAAQKFDPDRGYTFSTYAMWWIRQGVNRGIERTRGGNYRYEMRYGDKRYADPLSLDAPIQRHGSNGMWASEPVTIAELLPSDSDDDFDNDIADALDAHARIDAVRDIIGDEGLALFDDERTSAEIGSERGITGSSVRMRRVHMRRQVKDAA